QLQMFDALGARPPEFAHEALLVAAEGKLSKRLGALGVEQVRAAGLEPMALLSLLARLGTSQPVEPIGDLDSLARDFDFAHFGRAPAHFDLAEVEQLNRKLLHHSTFAEVANAIILDISSEDYDLLKGNIDRLSDLSDWLVVLDGDIDPPELGHDERALVKEAAAVAERLDWGREPWRDLTDALKASTGRKGKALFLPLRLALTGRDSGPEMAPLVARLGQARTVARLAAAARR
ncbi:MAG TPA: glutamate--tRNA ligase family protein, partial [Sphingomicrobium sp.]|nr:glutamate--tRNA ligase family protein [Sphingomicrobium sp.]